MPNITEAEVQHLVALTGADDSYSLDARLALPVERQVAILMDLVVAQHPHWKRSIPVGATDHDIVLHDVLIKVVRALKERDEAIESLRADVASLMDGLPHMPEGWQVRDCSAQVARGLLHPGTVQVERPEDGYVLTVSEHAAHAVAAALAMRHLPEDDTDA